MAEPANDLHAEAEISGANVSAVPTEQPADTEVSTADAPTGAAEDAHETAASTDPPATEEVVYPAIAPLKAMFPDFDSTVLHSILDSVGGDQERAIEVLLGMSDPSYVPQEGVPAPATQEELDEQLARRLALEDEHQHFNQQQNQRSWVPQGQQPANTWAPQGQGQVPYQARMRGAPSGAQGENPQGGPDRDVFDDLGESFNKIAESGKKTFSSLFAKAKQKLQEFDQGQAGQQQQQQQSTTPNWGGPSGYPNQPQQQQQPYYDPSAGSGAGLAHTQGAEGYDVSTPPTTNRASAPSQPVPIGSTPPPPSTQIGVPSPPIDGTRLGMLPKRPVSLISPQPTTIGPRTAPPDEEELEYVENPFDEHH